MSNELVEKKKLQRKELTVENVLDDPLVNLAIEAESVDDSETMKTVTIDASMYDDFFVACFGDIHIGGPGSNIAKYQRILETIKKLNNKAIVMLGDLMDNATLDGVSNPHESTLNPQQQKKVAIKLHSDKEINSSIAAMVGGNHDGAGARNKDTMGSPNLYVATALGLYEIANDFMCKIAIKLKSPYSKKGYETLNILARHGSGNGGRIGSSLDKTTNVEKVYGSLDMSVCGHFHRNETGETVREQRNADGTIFQKNLYCRSVNSFQEYAPYAATNAMAPSNTDPTIFRIQIVPNLDYELATPLERKNILPYKFKVDEICIESPEFIEYIEKQQIKTNLTHQENKQIDEVKNKIKKLFHKIDTKEINTDCDLTK